MNHFISMFIDDELDLDNKTEFVEKVHDDEGFYSESLDLLEQEKLIRLDPVAEVPPVQFNEKKRWFDFPIFNPFGLIASVGTIAAILLLLIFPFKENATASVYHRFVIYEPEVSKVEISGSFTDWKVLPLKKIGLSGYWQIELDIPQGEHRYTYILEEKERMADPTILTREPDDFGGENSILFAEA